MATRYWIGSGTWDSSNTTNWSTTNTGSGGASVPTSTDTVLAQTTATSCTLGADVSADTVYFGGTGFTFNTNNYNPTFGYLNMALGTLSLGSSTIYILTDFRVSSIGGVSFSCGTSTIKFIGTLPSYGTFFGGDQTFNIVWFDNNISSNYILFYNSSGVVISELKFSPNQKIKFGTYETFNVVSIVCAGTAGNETILDSLDYSQLGAIFSGSVSGAGSGYVVNDTITLDAPLQPGTGSHFSVDAVDGFGGVTAVTCGQDYAGGFLVGSEYTDDGTASPSGTGCKITVSSLLPIGYWEISDTSGSNNLGYVNVRGSKALGGASFISTNGVDLGYNSGWSFPALFSQILTDNLKTTPSFFKTTAVVKSETLRLSNILTSVYIIVRTFTESIRLSDIIDTVLYPFGFIRRKMVGMLNRSSINGSSNNTSYNNGSQRSTNIKNGGINNNNRKNGSMRKYR